MINDSWLHLDPQVVNKIRSKHQHRSEMDKRKLNSPLKVCQTGSNCLRLESLHFDEYSHPHLDFILEAGADPETGLYHIPDDFIGRSRIQQQLVIIKQKQSGQLIGNPSKLPRKESKEKESEVFQSKSEKSDSTQILTSSTSACQQEKKEPTKQMASSVSDFFKERSQAFKAKNPEAMRASSPPKVCKREMPNIPAQLKQAFPVVRAMGEMAEKLKNSAPYNMFLTTVTASKVTHDDPLSVTFLEILDPSLGELEASIQLNFTVDINWLIAQYSVAKLSQLPLIVLYGQEEPTIMNINSTYRNVKSHMIKVPGQIGCHHTKMMLLFYRDKSMRVVISTANLFHEDWHNRVQGVWISDRLPAMPQGAAISTSGESVTNFRKDLVDYLKKYQNADVNSYMDRIVSTDFSSIKVFLITSIPGTHRDNAYAQRRLGQLLKKHSAPIDAKVPIILQTSSVGNFGKSAPEYLTGEIVEEFQKHAGATGNVSRAEIRLIYPSLRNVKNSHDGLNGGGGLPYYRDAHNRQLWLHQHLYQWKSTSRNRNHAMPHIKSYCRYSDKGLFWFVLTSANMSKSAWGVTKRNALCINSYEAGVAFFPRVILDGRDCFPMNEPPQNNNTPNFKLPFDITPVPYEPTDAPFVIQDMMEYQMEHPESLMAMML